MSFRIAVENIKCGGCANSIHHRLNEFDDVQQVEVDIENGIVAVTGDVELRDRLVAALARQGYPETGSVAGISAAAAKAKSFVSCAVGRIDNHEE